MKKLALLTLSLLFLTGFQSCILEASLERSQHYYHYDDRFYVVSQDDPALGVNICLMAGIEGISGALNSSSQNTISPAQIYVAEIGNPKESNRGQYPSPIAVPVSANLKYNTSVLSNQKKFLNNFDLKGGLMLTLKRSKDTNLKVNSTYLEIPIYGTYRYTLKNNGSILAGFGPYIAYGIGGKTKSNNYSQKTFDKELGFKRFDAGLTFTAGYIFPMDLSCRLAYDLGLTDMSRDNQYRTKLQSFSLNVGYPISKILDQIKKQ